MPKYSSSAEALFIVDENSWVWQFCKSAAHFSGQNFLKISASIGLRDNWSRFQKAPFILLHWENKSRPSGALVEQILEVDEVADPTNRIIVVTTDPLHEDVVYFSELGLWRIIRLRNREDELKKAAAELKSHIESITKSVKDGDAEWRKLRHSIERLKGADNLPLVAEIRSKLERLATACRGSQARKLEAEAALALKTAQAEEAARLAIMALDINPNFFRAWNTLVAATTLAGKHEEAYALLQKLQLRNRASVKRLNAIGNELLALKDLDKAEQFFSCAIDHDQSNDVALNGLAEINFSKNQLDAAKKFLARSTRSRDVAIKLNLHGINMVKQKNFQEALTHYTNAQYVLPDNKGGHQIFYNIALAYAKWGKRETAGRFLKLALVKKPDYTRASNLLERLNRDTLDVEQDLDLT